MSESQPTATNRKLDDNEIPRLFQHGMHEGVFYTRLNFFLVLEGLLFASAISSFSGEKPLPPKMASTVCIFG